ncbi:hypothetical protein FYJ91_16645 [Sphingomonas montanisoli]|uniref:Uncharacterized protein n=2 Tax=Sphingomonas montanisoli TaxID=2606412 RepID=A0A5D9BZ90_9SPHN|nr:hypothetical protein FYJ91_16645 [Sphingomonas montanisoli]
MTSTTVADQKASRAPIGELMVARDMRGPGITAMIGEVAGEPIIVRFDTSAILALTEKSSSLQLIEEGLRSHHDRIRAAAAAVLLAGFASVAAEGTVITLSALDL